MPEGALPARSVGLIGVPGTADLFVLDVARVPEYVARMPRSALLPSPGVSRPVLLSSVSLVVMLMGVERLLRPLNLPFRLVGVPAPDLAEAITDALLSEPPPPVTATDVAAALAAWCSGVSSCDALDALWCLPGERRAGMASAGSRLRADAMRAHPAAAGYLLRSLTASLAADVQLLAGVGHADPVRDAVMTTCQQEAEGQTAVVEEWQSDISGIALVITPVEARAMTARPGRADWPANCWGFVILDDIDDFASWRVAFCDDAAQVAEAVSGRMLWPPLSSDEATKVNWTEDGRIRDVQCPDAEEELVCLTRWAEIALARVVPRHPRALGNPDDEVDW